MLQESLIANSLENSPALWTPQERARALAIAAELRRRGLAPTAAQIPFDDWLTIVSPQHRWDWAHLRYIRTKLERVTCGEIDRLMLFLPPRHGKSELVTVRYSTHFLECHPDKNVIIGAYNQTLANKFSRKARAIAEPRLKFNDTRTAVEEWETEKGGIFRAVGVGSGVTGQGGNLIIIDDPVKNREEAESQVYRDKVWDWYTDDLYTRAEPDAPIILIMCMTGDTPVLMADGTERPLREIKVGDRIATYDDGKLATSTVRNHSSNGIDSVYRIKTTCGKIVCANERHPFLVEEHGQLKWIRLKNLTTAQKIVTVKGSGANGREKHASLRDVRNLLVRGVIALHIITKRCGQMGIALHQLMQNTGAICVSSSDTESLPQNMMQCLRRKMADVLSANIPQAIMYAHIGAGSYVLTIATKPIQSEGFCAMTVILPWDTPKQRQLHLPSSNISDFTIAQIESIESAGAKEVFDIRVERTENFIANGLVSHNTRWHKDDLAGRILASEDGKNWEVVCLPAEAEPGDPLGRALGEALCPDRYDLKKLMRIKSVLGRSYSALYQQRPVPREGGMFKEIWLRLEDAVPAQARRVRWWDKASTEGGGDFTAGVLVAYSEGIWYVEDIVSGQWSSGERDKVIKDTARKDKERGHVIQWGEQEPGSRD